MMRFITHKIEKRGIFLKMFFSDLYLKIVLKVDMKIKSYLRFFSLYVVFSWKETVLVSKSEEFWIMRQSKFKSLVFINKLITVRIWGFQKNDYFLNMKISVLWKNPNFLKKTNRLLRLFLTTCIKSTFE